MCPYYCAKVVYALLVTARELVFDWVSGLLRVCVCVCACACVCSP